MWVNNDLASVIRSKVDIVDIIGERIPLTARGKNFFGVCPFHDDTNPSMSVSREKQIYRCFSCGASGNVFTFLMNYEHKEFPEVLKELGEKVGVNTSNIHVKKIDTKYDYLYVNGDNSHINVLHNNCGDNADYIAVNTFENCYGEYTSWEEEYLFEGGNKIFIPSTCSDPLACLVYLNWISNADNIKAILNANSGDNNIDPFTGDRYLLTCTGVNHIADMVDGSPVEQAKQTASEVQYIQRGNKCVRYNTSVFVYINTEIDIENTYPDSTKNFICKVIGSADGDFERVYNEQYEEYLTYGAYWIVGIRAGEWDKVMVRGAMIPS